MPQEPLHPISSEAMEEFIAVMKTAVDASRFKKALSMLKAERFQLFSDVSEDSIAGVVKSQTDPNLIYSCHLTRDGNFSCCTQNLFTCGGLRGNLCKHLLVLIIGLAQNGAVDLPTVKQWIGKSKGVKPKLDKDVMSEALLRYKGAEAGEIDWRPTETIPEDFYIY
jgi:hypothetical protein